MNLFSVTLTEVPTACPAYLDWLIRLKPRISKRVVASELVSKARDRSTDILPANSFENWAFAAWRGFETDQGM